DPDAWFGLTGMDPAERAEIDALIEKRQAARAAKDWAVADEVRDELNARKIQVDDGPEGSTWRKMAE
ncbi:cysteine--tRNA ligase, partial [Leifsonia sp. SIMBA_070]